MSAEQIKIIGLIVNPIAGMGGSVGLKGTDASMYDRAVELGATPVAPLTTKAFLSNMRHRGRMRFLAAPGSMGEQYLDGLGIPWTRVGRIGQTTTSEDTRRIALAMQRAGADLIVFVGGDGTARDIYDAIGLDTPVVAVPAGVKAYSAVFAVSARAAASILEVFIDGAELIEREVLDIDEEAFREGRLASRLYGYLLVPDVSEFVQAGKEGSSLGGATREAQEEIAEHVVELMDPEICYFLGPGTTVKAVADALDLPKTLLGVDAVVGGSVAGADLNERAILELLAAYPRRRIIVTPLGGSGFIFGRGNKQFTPHVLQQVGRDNVLVVATRDKLLKLRCLRVDTGDRSVDAELSGYMEVIVGRGYTSVVPVVS